MPLRLNEIDRSAAMMALNHCAFQYFRYVMELLRRCRDSEDTAR